eukprot:436739-Pleurochrysis_carterae.AAC.2
MLLWSSGACQSPFASPRLLIRSVLLATPLAREGACRWWCTCDICCASRARRSSTCFEAGSKGAPATRKTMPAT